LYDLRDLRLDLRDLRLLLRDLRLDLRDLRLDLRDFRFFPKLLEGVKEYSNSSPILYLLPNVVLDLKILSKHKVSLAPPAAGTFFVTVTLTILF